MNSRRVPLDKRKRTETSCDKCKARKQKCKKDPGEEDCHYCKAHDIKCLTTQLRKKRLYGSVEGIGYRLTLLESLVKKLYPDLDVSNTDEMRRFATSLGIELPDDTRTDTDSDQKSTSNGNEPEEPLSMLPDQQGQAQYIGPASSFLFHLKLRALVGQSGPKESVLFGRNAASEPMDVDNEPHALSTSSTISTVDRNSPVDHRTPHQEILALEAELLTTYFHHVNPDFPVLHEASFREAYRERQNGQADSEASDYTWMCSFWCVLLLARRAARVDVSEGDEHVWWLRVQKLLPCVVFTSSVAAVQALMLAALHLHNTNHRDACWNLTGTAIRIAVAIGLHQDKVTTMQSSVTTEMRKRLWWTLYAFEQMQVSSYDRPSAIEHPGPKVGCPDESLNDLAHCYPQEYSKWFNRLVVHLATACRAPKNTKMNAKDETYVGPLSPAAGVLRDLGRWRASLPVHLHMDAVDTDIPPCSRRALLLLHAKYHYTIIVLCRYALLTCANIISNEGQNSCTAACNVMADSCVDSGRALASILLKLDAIANFDPFNWWDIWYALICGSMLLIDIVSTRRRHGTDAAESCTLLLQLSNLCSKHMLNPRMPGTIRKWASMVPELYLMVDSLGTDGKLDCTHATSSQLMDPLPQELSTFPFQSTTNSGAYMFTYGMPTGRMFPEPDFTHHAGPFPPTGYVCGTQLNFMDFNSTAEWNFGDHTNLGMMPQGPP